MLAGPLSVVALIAGWVTTEVGRQPWVVYGHMRTEAAVTGAGGIAVGYATLAAVYALVAVGVVWILRRLAARPMAVRHDAWPTSRCCSSSSGWCSTSCSQAPTSARRPGSSRPRQDDEGDRLRDLGHEAMAPVWEANHVWLIFVLTVLWTTYPVAFGSIASTLCVPLFLAGLGIVVRGAAYALRAGTTGAGEARRIDTASALSSVLTPFALGAALGGIVVRAGAGGQRRRRRSSRAG